MSKVKMPKPAAWVRRHPDGALSAEFLEDAAIEPVRKRSGAWLPMITTGQAEAYAAVRVREALEEAAQACEARIGQHSPGMTPEDVEDCDEEARLCAGAIRALIK